jgi:hypothetical protein
VRYITVAVLALVAAACDVAGPLSGCNVESVQAAFRDGGVVLGWEQGCAVDGLIVYDDGGRTVWRIDGRFRPNVTYASVPGGAQQQHPSPDSAPPALVTGETYRVEVHVTGPRGVQLISGTFTVP